MSSYECEKCKSVGEELDDIYKGKNYNHTLYKCNKCNSYYFVKDKFKILDINSTKREDRELEPPKLLFAIIIFLIIVGLLIHFLGFSVFTYITVTSIIFVFSFLAFFIPWITVEFVFKEL